MKTTNRYINPKEFDKINTEEKPLSPELLKTFPGCEDYTELQALEIIRSLEKLCSICYSIASTEKIHTIDNQQVVYLNNKKNIAA
jgi:hypothetical protein